jgi:hypothetical protein
MSTILNRFLGALDKRYESNAGSPTTDRECSHVTFCVEGEEFEVTPPTATSDRVCEK